MAVVAGVGEAFMDAVRAVITAHIAQLAGPGVLSVRAGWKFTGGWPLDPPVPAVVVTVVHKNPHPDGGLLPPTIAGVAVDVRQASPLKRQALQQPDLPIPDALLDPTSGGLPVFETEVNPEGVPVLRGGVAGVVFDAAKPQLPYTAPDVALGPVTGTVTVQACASPDAGWPMLKAFLGSVRETLTVAMYDWTSRHVLDAVTADLADKTLRLVLDHPARNPSADQSDEDTATRLSSAFAGGGGQLTQAWALARSNPLAAAWVYPSAYHIKVAVADSARVWLSSGNWNNSSQPDIDPVLDESEPTSAAGEELSRSAADPVGNRRPGDASGDRAGDADAARSGNRDWHVVIDSAPLASVFEAYLRHDLAVAQAHQKAPAAAARDLGTQAALDSLTAAQSHAVAAKARAPQFAEFFAPTTVTDTMTVTPVLTPDADSYAPQVRALIDSATSSVYIQFQYIELPADPAGATPAFSDLIAAIIARQDAGVDVRIIMSEFEVQGYLEKLITAGLLVANTVRIQTNVHNQGIVVDGESVLVASQKWSSAGTTANRDAGVIIVNPALATYFQTLFLHDWSHLAAPRAAED